MVLSLYDHNKSRCTSYEDDHQESDEELNSGSIIMQEIVQKYLSRVN